MTQKKKGTVMQGMQLFMINPNHTLTPVGNVLEQGASPETWAKQIKEPGKYVCLPFLEILPGKAKPAAKSSDVIGEELGQILHASDDDGEEDYD